MKYRFRCPLVYIVFVLLSCSMAGSLSGQNTYADSLQIYQQAYKKDLYPIIRQDTTFVRFYPADENFRVTANVELLQHHHFFSMRASGGKPREAIRYALVTFQLHDKQYHLFAYQLSFLLSTEKHKDDFFIPFTDETSGAGSYAGGRYLDFVTGDIVDGKTLVIDFNKAYNPYCAFTTGYNCPIPPGENNLHVAITAGEKNFLKATH